MSAPVVLSVVLNMQTALQQITQANGYFSDVKASSVALDPQDLSMVPTSEMPFLVVGHRVDPQDKTFATSRPWAVREAWRITIEAALDATGNDTGAKITALTQFAADVERALVSDFSFGSGWGLTRGGVAMDTKVGQFTPYCGLPQNTRCYIEIPVDVLLQRQYGVA